MGSCVSARPKNHKLSCKGGSQKKSVKRELFPLKMSRGTSYNTGKSQRPNSLPSSASIRLNMTHTAYIDDDGGNTMEYSSHENLRRTSLPVQTNCNSEGKLRTRGTLNRFGFRGGSAGKMSDAVKKSPNLIPNAEGGSEKSKEIDKVNSGTNTIKNEVPQQQKEKEGRKSGLPVKTSLISTKSLLPVRLTDTQVKRSPTKSYKTAVNNKMKLTSLRLPTTKMAEMKHGENMKKEILQNDIIIEKVDLIPWNSGITKKEHRNDEGRKVIEGMDVNDEKRDKNKEKTLMREHSYKTEPLSFGFSSDEDEDMEKGNARDAPLDVVPVEEKKEKTEDGEDVWGRGEALAYEELDTINSNHETKEALTQPLRKIMLALEDNMFASLAILSTTDGETPLEDETFPDILIDDISSDEEHKETVNPETPNDRTTSISSDGKDYFDDEIADQPQLLFFNDARSEHFISPAQNENASRSCDDITVSISKSSSDVCVEDIEEQSSEEERYVRPLSPTESVTSEDLMLGFEKTDISGESSLVASNLNITSDAFSADCSSSDSHYEQENVEQEGENDMILKDVMYIRSSLHQLLDVLFKAPPCEHNNHVKLDSSVCNSHDELLSTNTSSSSHNEDQPISECHNEVEKNDINDVREELEDTKREVLLLQYSVKEKDQIIRSLHAELSMLRKQVTEHGNALVNTETVTSATQTDRVRSPSSSYTSSGYTSGMISDETLNSEESNGKD